MRAGLAVLAVLGVMAIGLVQGVLVLGDVTGDAAGAGMERGLRAMAAWSGVPAELGLAGFAVGALVPTGAARSAAWFGGLGAAVSWLGTALLAGGVAVAAQGPEWTATTSQVVGALWLAGWLGFGLSVGASRSFGSLVVAVLPLPLAVVTPTVLFLASS